MKLLFLLLFLSPAVLWAQTQKEVDGPASDDVSANIQSISAIADNNPCTRASELRITHNVTDSGEFFTTVVFFRKLAPLDSAGFDMLVAMPPAAAVDVKTNDILLTKEDTLDMPPFFTIIKDDGVALIDLLALAAVGKDGPAAEQDTLAVPPFFTIIKDDDVSLIDLSAITAVSKGDIPASEAAQEATIPDPPLMIPEEMMGLPWHPVVVINMEDAPFDPAEIITTPAVLRIIIAEEIDGLPPHAFVQVSTPGLSAINTDTVAPPAMVILVKDELESPPLHPGLQLAVAAILASKADTVAAPVWAEEARMPVEGMHLSEEGYSLLEKLEGFSPDLYSLNDGGFTIGFGFFVPFGESAKWSKGVTWEQAQVMIKQKVPGYEDQVKEFINVPLTQKEFDALTMLAYNLGGFSKATSIVNDVNDVEGFDKIQADWKRFIHSKAPNVAKGLMNRRKDELEVRRVANYQPERQVRIYKNKK